ncbi:MAG: hypothetical protein LBN23_00820, partial [Paludibacter sp.]|nr:hypothetical protein [Paludibacter sp.]
MEDGELRVKQSILEKYSHIFHKGEFKKVVPDDCELENIVDYQLKSYFPRKFTLEVTENCNLRCKYCLFAREENGITRKHTFCNMDIYTAKKAIDFYFNFYTSQLLKIPEDKQEKIASISPPRLSWWGGEPFLAFDIIKESKQYFESLNWGKFGIKLGTLTYITVSNLTIMNDEIATFLANNNVLLSVSLDGGKQENDLNRVLANGKGTFDIVIANLDFLIEKYPEYAKEKIIIQSVFAENIDIEKSYDFVKKHFNLNTPAKKIQKHIVFSEKKVKILFANNVKISKRNELDNFKIKLEELAEKSEEKIIDILK